MVKWPNCSAQTELSAWVSSADPGDRLDHRQRGSAEVACGGGASLVGKRKAVHGNKSRRLAASRTREASVAIDADMVDEGQMGGEKPVASIPMCQTFCDLIMTMRDTKGVSEVKCENFVERRVKHSKEKEMCQVLRSAGRLFLWPFWLKLRHVLF